MLQHIVGRGPAKAAIDDVPGWKAGARIPQANAGTAKEQHGVGKSRSCRVGFGESCDFVGEGKSRVGVDSGRTDRVRCLALYADRAGQRQQRCQAESQLRMGFIGDAVVAVDICHSRRCRTCRLSPGDRPVRRCHRPPDSAG